MTDGIDRLTAGLDRLTRAVDLFEDRVGDSQPEMRADLRATVCKVQRALRDSKAMAARKAELTP